MLWSVAARFGFTEAELWALPISRLRFWHQGHAALIAEERGALGGKEVDHG